MAGAVRSELKHHKGEGTKTLFGNQGRPKAIALLEADEGTG
jgi:hypothetical protein